MSPRAAIIGAGLAGNLLAIFLARRGIRPLVVERRARDAMHGPGGDRSINLALAARGLGALERADVLTEIEPLLLPLAGRTIHEEDQSERFAAYGQRADECIYSVSRAELNRVLYEIAHARHGVEYRFDSECSGVDATTMTALVDGPGGRYGLDAQATFATDGAGSAVRRALLAAGRLEANEALLDHGYKELTIRPDARGDFALDPGSLHIWPRDDYMLIALPNTDRSFTATLFLPLEGEPSFRSLDGEARVTAFFSARFPDALRHVDDLEQQFAAHPTGLLGTVRCAPWAHHADAGRAGVVLLLGDAAHAIVPFHGQGMNAAFEDIVVLDDLLGRHGADWAHVADAFAAARAADVNAIADMALDNYLEMRSRVRDPKFQLQRALELELERRFPGRFIPRYSMVMFHPEIAYAEAQRRGAMQRQLLDTLTRRAATLDEVDFERAGREIASLS